MDKKTFGVLPLGKNRDSNMEGIWHERTRNLPPFVFLCVDGMGYEKSKCPLPPQHSFYSCPFFSFLFDLRFRIVSAIFFCVLLFFICSIEMDVVWC